MGSFAFSQTTCSGTTSKNANCKIVLKVGNLCHHHGGIVNKIDIKSAQCNGTSKSTNNQCKLKTKHESGLCHHHRPKND